MDDIVELEDSEIYSGCDLSVAYDRSRVPLPARLRNAASPGLFSRNWMNDLQNVDVRHVLPRSCIVEGTDRDTGKPVRIGFSGTGRVVDYCARAMLGHSDYVTAKSNRKQVLGTDLIVTDHALSNAFSSGPAIRVPPWVRQARPIAVTWDDTLADLSAKLRSEIRRILRVNGYSAKLSVGATSIRNYFRDLHKPYITGRFADEAILSSESTFTRQRKHMVRLDLMQGRQLVAASLLEVTPKVLSIRSSAMHPLANKHTGRADALDYFALLIGQLLNCEMLDFGLSRPHAEDGALLYKMKWGATASSAHSAHKACIRISPRQRTEAVLSILRRNLFLQQSSDGLAIRVLFDAAAANLGSVHMDTLRRASRVAPVRIACLESTRLPPSLKAPGITVSAIHPRDDPLSIALQTT